MEKINVSEIVERMQEEMIGMKGRREARRVAENIIENMTGQKHAFTHTRETYHHYHVTTDLSSGGGSSIFVSFSGSKVKEISKH